MVDNIYYQGNIPADLRNDIVHGEPRKSQRTQEQMVRIHPKICNVN